MLIDLAICWMQIIKNKLRILKGKHESSRELLLGNPGYAELPVVF